MQASLNNGSACPYCGNVLKPRPKRKMKCPHCGRTITVRGGVLLTDEEATIRDWVDRVDSLGVSRKDFDRQRQRLSKQFGFTAPVEEGDGNAVEQSEQATDPDGRDGHA